MRIIIYNIDDLPHPHSCSFSLIPSRSFTFTIGSEEGTAATKRVAPESATSRIKWVSGLRSALGRFTVSCVAGNRISPGSASTGNDVDAVSSDIPSTLLAAEGGTKGGTKGNQVQMAAMRCHERGADVSTRQRNAMQVSTPLYD